MGLIDDYVVIERIGAGSFAKVHKARHKATGLIVALKYIDKKSKKDKEIAGIRREIEILTGLQHENIICMYDAFETPHEFVIAMEYARGELYDILEDDKMLPEQQVRSIAKQLVRALHYLHMNRVIHRDLKPQNILVCKNGTVKLCDFGFARTLSQQTVVLTSIKGTPLYMAPELVQEQPYNFSVDLWSLGCILYELFYGKPPFFTQNIYQLIDQIKKDPIKFPEPISPEFKSLLRGLLTKNAAQRLNWSSGLLSHPFIADSQQDAWARSVLAAQSRATRQKLENLGCIQVCKQFPGGVIIGGGDKEIFGGGPEDGGAISARLDATKNRQQQHLSASQRHNSEEKRNSAVEAALTSARMSMRNSISLKMERGFSRTVLDTIRSPAVEGGQLLEALTLAEQSTMTVVVNPLHSSVFLTRLGQDFFSRIVELICLKNNNGSDSPYGDKTPDIFARALSLLRLFVHPEGAATTTPFPSRAMSEEARSLLKLRSECRIELNVRQMAKQAVLESKQGAAIRVLLLEAVATNGNNNSNNNVSTKGHALAVLVQIARGSAEGAALVAQCLDFFPCMMQMFQQKLFSWPAAGAAAPVSASSVAASSQQQLAAADPFAVWRPVAVQFLTVMSSYWDLREVAAVVNEAVVSSAAGAGTATTTTATTTTASSSVAVVPPVVLSAATSDAELCYRSAICGLMQATLAAADHKLNSRTSSAAGPGSAGGAASPPSAGGGGGGSQRPPSSQHSGSGGPGSGHGGNNSNNNKAPPTLFTFDAQHLGYVLALVDAVLSRPRAVVSSRPCGGMFGLPDVGLLDDAVWCIGALYRAATTSAMSVNFGSSTTASSSSNLNSPNSNDMLMMTRNAVPPVGEAVVAMSLFAPLLNSVPFFEFDHGAFRALLGLLQAGSCGTTVPGFELSPVGVRHLLKAVADAAGFQMHLSPFRSVSCLLQPAPVTARQYEQQLSPHQQPPQQQDSMSMQPQVAISVVTGVLSSDWLQALEWWPSECGGGLVGARSTIHFAVEILNFSYLTPPAAPVPPAAQQQQNVAGGGGGGGDDNAILLQLQQEAEDAARVASSLQQHLLVERALARLFDGLDRLSVTERGPIFFLVSKLVFNSPAFAAAFLDSGGMQPTRMQSLVQPHSPCRGDALLILCHLSRSSKDVYIAINDAGIYPFLLHIVQRDASDVLRGRVCNLVGNLCKHNATLYLPLKQAGLIAEMVARCSRSAEPDENARKFACFAVGNAAFHSDVLYPELGAAVPAIVDLLKSADDKTRQNAAGAIGNLVRNGPALIPLLTQHRAVEELVRCLAAGDSTPGLKKIVVFSLGTLAQMEPCRQGINLEGVDAALRASADAIRGDLTFAKYVARLKQKLPGLKFA